MIRKHCKLSVVYSCVQSLTIILERFVLKRSDDNNYVHRLSRCFAVKVSHAVRETDEMGLIRVICELLTDQ